MKTVTYPFITAAFGLLLSSCAIQAPPHRDTSKISYSSKTLNYQEFQNGKLAILPIVLEENSNINLKETAGEILYNDLRYSFPKVTLISANESARLINNADLSGEYAHLIDDNKISGILRKSTLNKMQSTMGSRYFLYTELYLNGFPKHGIDKYGHPYSVNAVANEYTYNCQLWDSENAELVWKGEGSEAKAVMDTLISNNELLACAADNLTTRLAKNIADVPNGIPANSIIDEINAQRNTNVGIFLSSFVIGYTALLIILGGSLHHHH